MEYRVYVLENPTAKRYIGVSSDVARRVEQHNSSVSTWTRNKGPWRLVWWSELMLLSDARKLENQLKRQKGGRGLDHLIGQRSSHS